MNWRGVRQEWFSHPARDLLAGVIVALALIPEAIAFSIIAGVAPEVGLYASFCLAVVIAFAGGRVGMISGATAAMALLMQDIVRDHGLPYLLAATLLTGLLQLVAGFLRVGEALRFVPRSVMVGFVNALAILIFTAQIHEFHGAGWPAYAMVAAGLGIIYLLPLLTKTLPSSLVCIVLLSVLAVTLGLDLRTVADLGPLPSALPVFQAPAAPLNLETLRIIAPVSVSLAAVGLLESLMTATVLDEYSATPSDKNRECVGQGAANLVAGFLGGMAGCAMIGQTVINWKAGGRGRLSTLAAGVFLLIFVVLGGAWVRQIPMAALVAVMISVAIGTFSWRSLAALRRRPDGATITMIVTTLVIVVSQNLAIGVLAGLLVHGAFILAARSNRSQSRAL